MEEKIIPGAYLLSPQGRTPTLACCCKSLLGEVSRQGVDFVSLVRAYLHLFI